jgi:hypothetical protein
MAVTRLSKSTAVIATLLHWLWSMLHDRRHPGRQNLAIQAAYPSPPNQEYGSEAVRDQTSKLTWLIDGESEVGHVAFFSFI